MWSKAFGAGWMKMRDSVCMYRDDRWTIVERLVGLTLHGLIVSNSLLTSLCSLLKRTEETTDLHDA